MTLKNFFLRVYSINTLPLYFFGVNAFELAGIALLVFLARYIFNFQNKQVDQYWSEVRSYIWIFANLVVKPL